MKASGKIGSNGFWASDNVEKLFETDIHTHTDLYRIVILSENVACRFLVLLRRACGRSDEWATLCY
jgi:hypothetical protein